MGRFRSYDAFSKPVEGLRTQTPAGGLITILSGLTAAFLFLSQLIVYSELQTYQHFEMAASRSMDISAEAVKARGRRSRSSNANNIKLFIHVSFPYIECNDITLNLNGLADSSLLEVHGPGSIIKRPTSKSDVYLMDLQDVKAGKGCTVQSTMYVPRVGGSFGITVSSQSWIQISTLLFMNGLFHDGHNNNMPKTLNVTHYIHEIEFGTPFPLAPNPLQNTRHVFHRDAEENTDGLGLEAVAVKLVETQYKRFGWPVKETFQPSVTQHHVMPETLAAQNSAMLPGLSVVYDFTPLSVHHTESRENFVSFLASLISIVAGVFVTVTLLSSCLLSAATVGKKID